MAQQTQLYELQAEKRTLTGKQVGQLRREGRTPAVMYGHNFAPIPLQVETKALQHLLAKVGGSQLIQVRIAGEAQPEMALIREVQRDPIRRHPLHVDLYRVSMTERITTEVALELVGESPVIARNDGILLQGISQVEVECLPGDLVNVIPVDISRLTALEQSLHVKDLVVPPGIEILTDPDEMIVRVMPLAEEEVIEVGAPEVMEVEIIREAKRKEEE